MILHSLLPSKLHRRAIDFFVEESGYSVQLGTGGRGGSNAPMLPAKAKTHSIYTAAAVAADGASADANNLRSRAAFSSGFATVPPSWTSGNTKEKEK